MFDCEATSLTVANVLRPLPRSALTRPARSSRSIPRRAALRPTPNFFISDRLTLTVRVPDAPALNHSATPTASALPGNAEALVSDTERGSRKKPIHCHVLVWGLYDGILDEDHPVNFFKNFDDDVKIHQLRWLPTEWSSPSIDDIKEEDIKIPVVNKALWIVLAEVF